MSKFIYYVNSPEETMALASKLAQTAFPQMVLTLEGELGAGKTTFTKGFAKGLGINAMIKSPTFTIVREYEGNLPLYHMDVYRLVDSFEDLGFEQYFYGTGVTIIEWASLISEHLPQELLKINISHVDINVRKIELIPLSEKYIKICEELV